MPLLQIYRCEACDYEWDDLKVTQSVTVGTIDPMDERSYTLHSCPGCSLTLKVQHELDGNSWRHWRGGLPELIGDLSDQLMERVSGRIEEILATRRTIYQPIVIDLGEVRCIRCEIPLVPGPVDRPLPHCPVCQSHRVTEGASSIVTLLYDPTTSSDG